jgi:hypothetical protein
MLPRPVAVTDEAVEYIWDRNLGLGEGRSRVYLAATTTTGSPTHELVRVPADAIWPFYQQLLTQRTSSVCRRLRFSSNVMPIARRRRQGFEGLDCRKQSVAFVAIAIAI